MGFKDVASQVLLPLFQGWSIFNPRPLPQLQEVPTSVQGFDDHPSAEENMFLLDTGEMFWGKFQWSLHCLPPAAVGFHQHLPRQWSHLFLQWWWARLGLGGFSRDGCFPPTAPREAHSGLSLIFPSRILWNSWRKNLKGAGKYSVYGPSRFTF